MFFTTPRSALCLSKIGIAPSQKEKALTPRCLFSPFSPCSLCEPCFLNFGTNENRGIAPSRKEEALTPRCPWGNRGVSVFYDPAIPLLSFYSAVLRLGTPWERRTLVRHIFSFSERNLPLAIFSSVFSVTSVRTLFFDLLNE